MKEFLKSIELYCKDEKCSLNENILDEYISRIRKKGNTYIKIHPYIGINNGGTIKDGTGLSLTGNFYFEIAKFNNTNLVKLIYSQDLGIITDDFEQCKYNAIKYIVEHKNDFV